MGPRTSAPSSRPWLTQPSTFCPGLAAVVRSLSFFTHPPSPRDRSSLSLGVRCDTRRLPQVLFAGHALKHSGRLSPGNPRRIRYTSLSSILKIPHTHASTNGSRHDQTRAHSSRPSLFVSHARYILTADAAAAPPLHALVAGF